MAAILLKAFEGYHFLFEEIVDPRTKTWFLVARPYQGLFLLGLYLMFVLKWGPKYMEKRKPFNLDKILIIYNIFQVLICGYIFWGAIWYAWGWKYKWICEPVDFSNSFEGLRVAKFVHYYFLCKVIDLLDTVFFVLRKKFNQISFLHVYHHTGMVMLTWGAITYFPGGHGTFIGVINSFVHMVMYGYYLLTVAYPVYKESLWWKKYITQLQILQFFWCVVHMVLLVFKRDCDYPRWTAALFLPQNLFMLILFIDFYIKAYVIKPKAKAEAQKNGLHTNVVHTNGVHTNGVHTNGVDTNGVSKSKEVNGTAKVIEEAITNGKSNLNGKARNGVSKVHENGSADSSAVSNGLSSSDVGVRKRIKEDS